MPSIFEANGEVFEGKIVICPLCGEEWETYNPQSADGSHEDCDDCMDESLYGETEG